MATERISKKEKSFKYGDNEKVAHIYVTAADLFYKKGFDATSVNDIADALNLTKAGLYHYISSKQSLLFGIMSWGMDRLEKEVIDPAKEVEDAEERLCFIIENHARIIAEGIGAVTILLDEVQCLTPDDHKKIRRRKRDYVNFLKNTLATLKAEGKLHDVDLTTATFSILGMVLWISRWFRHDGEMTWQQVTHQVRGIALRGILLQKTAVKKVGTRN